MTREQHIDLARALLVTRRGEYGVWHPTEQDLQQAQIHAILAVAAALETAPVSQPEAVRKSWWQRVMSR